MLPELDKLCPTVQIRLQPRQYRPKHAELCLQPLRQCRVAHGVEGCRQVEADEYCHLLVVSSSVNAVKNIEAVRAVIILTAERLLRIQLPLSGSLAC